MQNDKQQTAVDFLITKLWGKIGNSVIKVMETEIEQAKEIEKQDLINMAYLQAINISKDAKDQLTPEELYTETYGKHETN